MKRNSSIKRSGFKKSSLHSADPFRKLKSSRLKTGDLSTVRVSKDTRARRPMNRVGPRTREWQRVWRFLKPKLEAAGRTKCEFYFILHNCCGILDPVHSKKRRMMKGADIYKVAIGCRNVHDYLDLECPHEEMERLVMEAIERAGGLILPEREAA